MMQITGKSASFRGLTLLLALMLGAGLALTGCGDDDSSTTTPAPAPTPAPQPPAPEPPGTPANLRVADTGVDYIEFAWDAVEGATGYEVQMSMTEGDFGQAMMATVTGTMHKFMVAAETTAYGRVRATNDDGASDWSEPAMGMSMAAPMVLGVPVPEVSSTGPDHIEWSWEAIMNAQGYQVQVADSMDGLADAEMMATTETSHRVDAEPDMTMYIRVRSAVLLPSPMASEWSMAVEGMSDVMPMPFVVSMTPPEAGADRVCSGQAFCPDSMTDVKKAMAGPNKMMMVSSSHQAQVSPEYIDDAAAVDLNVGDNTPFQFVSWDAMQSMVAGDGVTFMLQRISTAAGQEPMPMGDKMYITCGPFECSDAMDEVPAAPDITIANSQACTDFEAELTLNVGLGYNGGSFNGFPNAGMVDGAREERMRGIDAGWTYTSTSSASVMHELKGVIGADGGSLKVKGSPLSPTSTPKALSMTKGTGNNADVNHFGGSYTDATTAGGGPIWNGTEDCFSTTAPAEDAWNTVGYSYANISGAAGVAGTRQKPQHCFRIVTAGRPSRGENISTRQNFLPGYTVHVTPNASVTWAGSSVSWPKGQDPFDGLDCEGVSFDAMDDTDVCGSFQEQAMAYWGKGVGNNARTSDFMFEYIVTTDSNETVDPVTAISSTNPPAVTDGWHLRKINIIPRMTIPAASPNWKAASVRRAPNSVWSSLWLVDSTKKTTATAGDHGEQRGRDNTVADADMYRPEYGQSAWLRGYPTTGTDRDTRLDTGNTGGPAWRPLISVELMDTDEDPMYDDFGKVDFDTTGTDYGKADNFPAANSDADACSSADNGDAGDAPCDAEVEFNESFTFALHQDTSDCTQTIEVSFTCTWDADGDEDRTGDGQAPEKAFGAENIGNFVTCTMN